MRPIQPTALYQSLHPKGFAMIGYDERLWHYNCQDCAITFELADKLQFTIDQMRLREPADFQQNLFNAVLESMIRGVRVDVARRAEFEKMLSKELDRRSEWFKEVLGHSLNPGSPKQMKELFYKDLNLKPIKNRDGNDTLGESALITLGQREPILLPLIRKILEYRSIGVFLSTFVRMPLDDDSRMRCSFNIAGTGTYRFSSSENPFGNGGNLQNLPKGGDDGDGLELPNIRALFLPDPGYTFFDIDLSKADLRIVYWEADEAEGKAMLKEGRDPYVELAREFFKDPSIKKLRSDGTEHPLYKMFKSFAHGTHYLGSAFGLAQRLGLTRHEAEKTQAWYFSRFPKVKKYQEDIINQVNKRHYVENIFGYRYYIFDRIDDGAYRAAAAWKPQSTVACVINRGYYNLYKNYRAAQVLLQVHDSLAGQFPTNLPEAKETIIRECSIPLPYDDPLTIPVGIKTSEISWGDCG